MPTEMKLASTASSTTASIIVANSHNCIINLSSRAAIARQAAQVAAYDDKLIGTAKTLCTHLIHALTLHMMEHVDTCLSQQESSSTAKPLLWNSKWCPPLPRPRYLITGRGGKIEFAQGTKNLCTTPVSNMLCFFFLKRELLDAYKSLGISGFI